VDFALRFDGRELRHWASRFSTAGDAAEEAIGERARAAGFLTKPDFLKLCEWKTPRSRPLCASNGAAFVRAVTRASFATADERLRIEVLLLLSGVNWPTASAILHFAGPARYPVLDVRAIWSAGLDRPPRYDFALWWSYTRFCRRLARASRLTMREVDRALWQYSKENQL
jgi:hypothetical protein